MGTAQGSIGGAGSVITFENPVSINCTLGANLYPNGTLTFDNISDGNAYWKNNGGYARSIDLYLCDSAGNNRVFLFTVSLNPNGSNTTIKSATVSNAQGLTGQALYLVATGDTGVVQLRRYTGITITTEEGTHDIGGVGATGGSFTLNKYSATAGETITYTASPNTGWSASAPTSSPSLTMTSAGANKWTFTMPNSDVSIYAHFSQNNYTASVSTTPSGGGSASLSKTSAHYQDQITVTASPSTGWKVKSITTNVSGVSVSNNKFTMPASNITVTVTFEKITYSVTVNRNPAAGGTASTNKATANYGDTVTLSKTTASGYYFNGWTSSPSVSINGSGQFTMPNGNITVTANWLKYSTATVSTKSLISNSSFTLSISPDKNTYSHKYKLSFGTGMETSLTNVAAGTTSVSISVPDSWASAIPNATQKTGGTLIVETYNGSTKIGTFTITGFTYTVRDGIKPTLGTITKSIVRTVGGQTYANIGELYTQNKSAVRVQATATGAQSSTISSMTVTLSGYSGSGYSGSTSSGSLDWTSGLLTISGQITITVTATDSRGRSVTGTTTFTVTAYSRPAGTLSVKRVNAGGTEDVMGVYATFTKTSSYTAIGSNTFSVTLTSQGTNANVINTDSGDLLPGSGQRQTFSEAQEYTITLTLQDSFETVVITTKLPTAQFIFAVGSDGTRFALMKAVNGSLSKGSKTAVIEFSDTAQIYVGNKILEYYVAQSVMYEGLIIGSNEYLNDYITAGVYMVPQNDRAQTLAHCPTNLAGKLFVMCANSNVIDCAGSWRYFIQTYINIYGDEWRRNFSSDANGNITFGAWKQVTMT